MFRLQPPLVLYGRGLHLLSRRRDFKRGSMEADESKV